jgi:ribosomal protein S18 acetylase RimI-like enzyme
MQVSPSAHHIKTNQSSLLTKAIENNWGKAWSVFDRLPNARLHHRDGLVWFETGIRDSLLNAVLYTKLSSSSIDAMIEKLKLHFCARSLPMSWYIGPSTQPGDLAKRLEAQGFGFADQAVGMAIDLQQQTVIASKNPEDLVIERIADVRSIVTWVNLLQLGFGYSDEFAHAAYRLCLDFDFVDGRATYHYLGILNGAPAATSTLLLSDGVAGICDVSTAPPARGMGLGTALTLAAIRDAQKMGYHVLVLRSSGLAEEMYRRIGFRKYCVFDRYSSSCPPL